MEHAPPAHEASNAHRMQAELARLRQELAQVKAERDHYRRRAEVLRDQALLRDLAHDAILVRSLSGAVAYWNPGAEEQYGWQKEEVIGRRAHDLLGTRFEVSLDDVEATLHATSRWEGTVRQIRRDGTEITVRCRWVLLRDEAGEPSSVLELNDDISARIPDGEALAAALAPAPEARPALPPMLRAWLGARNPLLVPYMAWSAGFAVLTLGNVFANATGNPGSSWWDVALLLTATSLPLFPIVGFQLDQARRQFKAGHTLADLRSALEIGRRERAETEALARADTESPARRALRVATIASATWLAVTFALVLQGTINEHRVSIAWFLAPLFLTMLLGAVSNALDVQFIPDRIRAWWQTGIRDRLWNSRAGEWLARRLGAPAESRAVGGGVFRPTEMALGLAAGELFAALPKPYREQLAELPATVAALEARAAEARADLDVVAALAPSGSQDADVLARRREAASSRLAASVAALEGLRLDLLRLHAGADDLAPLTTLIDEARLIGADVDRLVEARREVDEALGRRPLGAAGNISRT